MLTRPESPRSVPPADDAATPARAPGLIVARIGPDSGGGVITVVDELDRATIDRIRRTALTLRARYAAPITIEARYVEAPETEALVGTLEELRPRGIHLRRATHLAPPAHAPIPAAPEMTPVDTGAATDPAVQGTPYFRVESVEAAARPSIDEVPALAPTETRPDATDALHTATPTAPAGVADRPISHQPLASRLQVGSADPFGVDRDYRRVWMPPLRFLFERYWRTEVSGIENVPTGGGVLIAANHSGAIPADAFMLAVALELHHPAQRCLRVLYDKFVDALPWIGPFYNRLGGVPSSFANAELMLRRGEALALFPEGIAGVEKRWHDRYQLQPFRSGTARLSLATGAPIVPVAIVGAEEAYPVVARLYRVGRLVGVPWIPVTPLFPLCGVAGAVPLPTKWRMRFCPPIHPPAASADAEKAVEDLTAEVRSSIARALGDLLLTRRGVFI